ncbi:hypothetical protein [Terrabacter aerolatus]|nr:hypothetical protein [Terrabacter aerolatus]
MTLTSWGIEPRRIVALVAAMVIAGVAGACTSDTGEAPRPTAEQPSMTPVPDGGGTSEVLRPPEVTKDELSRIVVRNAEGLFWDGSKDTRSVTRAGQRHRLTGRCLSLTAGGALVVEVLGPGTAGAVEGAPSQPAPGEPVASFTVPCDGTEASLDLPALTPSSGELTVAEATSQVAQGWVVLSRVA